ncbi:MAG: PAS domain S-box protein [Nevskia sp.]|nr:PAS domain S-box protein [Nevskia sp.]
MDARVEEQRSLLADIVESSGNAIVGVSLDGTVLSWNAAASRLYGYTPSEMIGRPVDVLTPAGGKFDAAGIIESIKRGAPVLYAETVRRRKDGSLVEVSINVSPIRDGTGAIVGAASITNDLTQRDRLQQALQESELRFRALIEEATDVIFVMQPDGRMSYVSPSIKRAAGYAPEELVGRSFLEFIHPEDAKAALGSFQELVLRPEGSVQSQARYRHKDGSWRHVEAVGRNLLATPGVNGFVVNLRDVTERVLAEQAERKSSARLSALVANTTDVVSLIARDGTVEYVSPALLQVGGYQPDEVSGGQFLDFVHPDDRPVAARIFAGFGGQAGQAFRAVWRLRHKGGSWRVVEVVGRDCTDVPGVGAVIVTWRDVTDRRQQDQARRDGDAMLRAITRSARDAIVVIDHDGRVAFWNEGAAALYGYQEAEALGQEFARMIPPEDRQSYQDDFRILREAGKSPFTTQSHELLALTSRNEKVPIELTLTPVRLHEDWNVLLVARDIAQRKRAEAEEAAHGEAIRQALEDSIQAVAATLEARDPYTAGHSRRVAELSGMIGALLGFSEDQLRGLRLAAGIHDIGKIGVPAEILNKPGQLSEIELSLVKTHAQAGYEILKKVRFPWPIAEIILQHHERLDGSGYPRGLKGEQILREARILAVADVVESMMQHRPYRAALGPEAALAEIAGGRGTRFDADVVDACVKLFKEQDYKFAA